MGGTSGRAAQLEAETARFDAWVAGLGGCAGRRFIALCNEAREFGGPGGYWSYLDMARAIDEDHAAGKSARETRRRAEAEAARRTAAAEAAIGGCLRRSAEIQLAADALRQDPRVARILDAELDGPGLTSAEVASSCARRWAWRPRCRARTRRACRPSARWPARSG
ncbi:MAG: hypothetical protein ACRDPY_28295 [Streptosporangiaceae bacterium]